MQQGSFGSPWVCAGPTFAFCSAWGIWNISSSFSFYDFSVVSLALSIGMHSNFLLPTVMIMFLGFRILITGVTFLVDVEGLSAASSFGTSGSASSLTLLSFAISGNSSSRLYTSAGASLLFLLHLDSLGISLTLQTSWSHISSSLILATPPWRPGWIHFYRIVLQDSPTTNASLHSGNSSSLYSLTPSQAAVQGESHLGLVYIELCCSIPA